MPTPDELSVEVQNAPSRGHDDHPDVVLVGYEGQENLGLRSIAAFLASHGIRVVIQPCHNVSNERILSELQEMQPRIVGFSLIFQRMLPEFAQLIVELRQGGIAAHFTMGGHFPTFASTAVLETVPGLDSIVRYEGERTMLALVRSLDEPAAWDRIQGLAYRRNGKVVVTPPRPLIEDLDALPVPARRPEISRHRGLGVRSIASSRGCYYDCSFCSIQAFYETPPGPKRRTRSPLHIVDEMETLFHDLDTRIFIFQDDDFYMQSPQHRRWMADVVNELHRRDLADRILWRISCRIDDINAGLLHRMKQAGLASVYLGIESGNEQGLSTASKHFGVEDIFAAIGTLRSIDMPFEYGFMLLDPDSALASVRENIEFLRRIGQDGRSQVNFCKMIPYAGTPIAQRLDVEGRLTGTLAAPDYQFQDRRMNLLELFISKTFNFRNFDERGLVERLRFAKFDSSVVERFYADSYDVRAYRTEVYELSRRSNETAVQTLSLATGLAEDSTYERMLDFWPLLQGWGKDERIAEQQIGLELNQLMTDFEFESDLA